MVILIILGVLIFILYKNKNELNNGTGSNNKNLENYSRTELTGESQEENQNADIDFAAAYQAKYLLSKNELAQYKKLKKIADVRGFVICPKVRLFDIIEPKRDHVKYKTLMYKIQAKHVDFVVCDNDMQIKVIIELDDNTHYQKKRMERDSFVDSILQSVGYRVIHTKYIENDIFDFS